MDADTKRGVLTNGIALGILLGLGWILGLVKYALLATGLQWAVLLVHGLPYNSEKFFDASGSLTYLLVTMWALLKDPMRSLNMAFGSSTCNGCKTLSRFRDTQIPRGIATFANFDGLHFCGHIVPLYASNLRRLWLVMCVGKVRVLCESQRLPLYMSTC